MRSLPTPPALLPQATNTSAAKKKTSAKNAAGSSATALQSINSASAVSASAMDPAMQELLQAKKIVKPVSDPNLLAWAGDVQGVNSRYREDFKHFHHRYASVIPPVQKVSLACNRLMPQSELSEYVLDRPVKSKLARDKQTRFMLKKDHAVAAPSWHLLYKDGVSYTVGKRHDPGEKSIYGLEYAAKSGSFKPTQPTIDPFESNIKIKMSDFKYLNTTYADTICASAKLRTPTNGTLRGSRSAEGDTH